MRRGFDGDQTQFAVVDEERVARLDGGKDFGMRKISPRRVAGRCVVIQNEVAAFVDHGRVVDESAEPQLRALQIDQNADRPIVLGLDGADRPDELPHLVMRRVTHVDAEHVNAGREQPADDGLVRRRRAERRHDLGPPLSPHRLLVPGAVVAPGVVPAPAPVSGVERSGLPEGKGFCGGCSADSVSCTVQARCSPVSTSKKPVRS